MCPLGRYWKNKRKNHEKKQHHQHQSGTRNPHLKRAKPKELRPSRPVPQKEPHPKHAEAADINLLLGLNCLRMIPTVLKCGMILAPNKKSKRKLKPKSRPKKLMTHQPLVLPRLLVLGVTPCLPISKKMFLNSSLGGKIIPKQIVQPT